MDSRPYRALAVHLCSLVGTIAAKAFKSPPILETNSKCAPGSAANPERAGFFTQRLQFFRPVFRPTAEVFKFHDCKCRRRQQYHSEKQQYRDNSTVVAHPQLPQDKRWRHAFDQHLKYSLPVRRVIVNTEAARLSRRIVPLGRITIFFPQPRRAFMKSAPATPACFKMPCSVPVFSSWCSGTRRNLDRRAAKLSDCRVGGRSRTRADEVRQRTRPRYHVQARALVTSKVVSSGEPARSRGNSSEIKLRRLL